MWQHNYFRLSRVIMRHRDLHENRVKKLAELLFNDKLYVIFVRFHNVQIKVSFLVENKK